MFDDRYKYTQVPSPLVQPGGVRGLLDLGSTTVIGEDPDVCCDAPHSRPATSGGTAPKAHKPHSSSKPLVNGNPASSKKKIGPGKIIAIVIVAIVAINLIFGALTNLALRADSFFDDVEEKIDHGLDGMFEDEHVGTYNQEISDYASEMEWGTAYEAFEGDNGYMYYYLPDEDIFLGDEGKSNPVSYYHFSTGYLNIKGGRIAEPEDIYDSKYADKALHGAAS